MGDSRYTASEAERLQKNRDALCSVVAGTAAPRRPEDRRTLGLELERVVIDPASGTRIAFDDVLGLSTLLEHWSRFFGADERVVVDGRLFGYAGTVDVGCGRTVGITVSLEPGGQLEASVGPSESVVDLLAALEAFDEQWVALCDELGVEWQLVALGCDPLTADPQEVPLIPKERYRLMDAYLSRTGRYARDMMRLSASTQVSIDCGAQDSVVEQFRLAVALGPIISFLCDNVSSWRGLSPEDTPSMVRSRIWESVDADRCGVVPGTFEDGFSSERYVDWLLGVRPILFTDDHGLTIATCSATEADILAMRDLSSGELAHMLSMVFPTVRLKGIIEMRDADSMPPRLACALAAFIKGIFYDKTAFEQASRLLVKGRTDEEVALAYGVLRKCGWDATIYGTPFTTVVQRLIQLAENGLSDPDERRIFHGLSSLWQSRLVPRDLYR